MCPIEMNLAEIPAEWLVKRALDPEGSVQLFISRQKLDAAAAVQPQLQMPRHLPKPLFTFISVSVAP